MKRNNLLVIIVTYNAMPWAKRCLDSLRSSSISSDILLIDNGSSDGTLDFVKTYYPEVEIQKNGCNLGFGKANNIGLQRVLDNGYDFAYLLNQDAWVYPDTFQKLIAVSNAHPEFGVFSPMQMAKDNLHLEDRFGNFVLRNYQIGKDRLLEDLFFSRLKDIYEVSFVMAAHWLITSSCITKVGGFSPTFPHYGEDVNYLQRLSYWGIKAGIVPSAVAVHDRSDSHWKLDKEIYVNDYIGSLVQASNPLHPSSIFSSAFLLFRKAFHTKHWAIVSYAFRLLKENKRTNANYQNSLKEKAFLS